MATSSPHPGFHTTRWSVVVRAASGKDDEAREALEELCRAYWGPIYGYVRRRGHPPDEARDLTQGFFLEILERGVFARADPERGRLRNYLLGALRNTLANKHDRSTALKRGGGHWIEPLEFDRAESRFERVAANEESAERAFERDWARTLIDRVFSLVREESEKRGRAREFDALAPKLVSDQDGPSYAELAEELESPEGALRIRAYRLRRRFREVLTREIAQTLADPGEVEEEIKALFRALEEG